MAAQCPCRNGYRECRRPNQLEARAKGEKCENYGAVLKDYLYHTESRTRNSVDLDTYFNVPKRFKVTYSVKEANESDTGPTQV
jgi:hypothetical protein